MSCLFQPKPKALHYRNIYEYAKALEAYIKYLKEILVSEGYVQNEIEFRTEDYKAKQS